MKTYDEMREIYHFVDSVENRRRWKSFCEHQRKTRERKQHAKLFHEDRKKWKAVMHEKLKR